MQRERCDEENISHCTIVNPIWGFCALWVKNSSKAARLLSWGGCHVVTRDARSAEVGTAPALFARCRDLLRQGDPRANSVLGELLDHHPFYAPGWEDLGVQLLAAGKGEAAVLCLRRALAAAPGVRLAMAYGDALKGLGRRDEARVAFAEACCLDPCSTRAAFQLGLCAQDAGDLRAARTAYERVLALDPKIVEAWVNLGIVLQAAGDLVGAKRAYGAAVARRSSAFGRVSQALSAAPAGELWLDLGRLRRTLAG